jgi:outer membrane murein-binding lipoprotein Lpp
MCIAEEENKKLRADVERLKRDREMTASATKKAQSDLACENRRLAAQVKELQGKLAAMTERNDTNEDRVVRCSTRIDEARAEVEALRGRKAQWIDVAQRIQAWIAIPGNRFPQSIVDDAVRASGIAVEGE